MHAAARPRGRSAGSAPLRLRRFRPALAGWPVILLAGACLAPVPAFPQAEEETPEAEVVVTAARRRQPKETASAPVAVITAAEIAAAGASTAAEALRDVPGLHIPRQGALGATSVPSLRGSSGGQVLVLIDGRRANNPQNGETDLSDIPTANIERIEVVRGGASALYGSDAVGGVINIITKTPTDVPETRLLQGYGSFNTQTLSGSHSASTGRFRYSLTGQRVRSTNDFRYFDPTAGQHQERVNSGYEAWDVTGKVIADLGARRRLTFSAEYGEGDKEVPGATSWPTPRAHQRDRRTLLDLHYQMPTGPQGDLEVRIYRVAHRNTYTDPDTFPAPTDARHRTTVDVVEALGHHRPVAGHDLTYGYEFRNQHLDSNTVGRRSRVTNAAYVQDQIGLGRLQVIPGVRLDLAQGFAAELSPKVGLVYRFSDTLIGRANVGRSFRAPTLNDLYWPEDGFSLGNPGLGPERALTADVGATWHAAPGLEVEATAFTHRVSDLIAWQPDIVTVGKWSPTNIGKARVTGIELGSSWQASERLTARANLTYQDARDRGGAATDGKRLIARPEWIGGVGATYRAGKATAAVEVRYTGPRPADADNSTYLGAAMVTDLRLAVPVSERVTAVLHLANLFDARYEMQAGYPIPGRTITLRLTEQW